MPDFGEIASIRLLPAGNTVTARVENRSTNCLSLVPLGKNEHALCVGSLVEVETQGEVYFGKVADHRESLVTVAVELFIDRTALLEIERSWKAEREKPLAGVQSLP